MEDTILVEAGITGIIIYTLSFIMSVLLVHGSSKGYNTSQVIKILCFHGCVYVYIIKICAICKHITLSYQILFYRKTKLSSAMACHICDWYHLWPKCGYSGSFHHINRKCVMGGGWHCFGPDRFRGLLFYSNSVPLQSAEVCSTSTSQSCITKLYFWIALFVKYNILIRDGKYSV